MRRIIAVTSTAMALAACSTTPVTVSAPATRPPATTTADRISAATAASAAWMALGTEPFWNIEVTTAQITYIDADGRRLVTANPGPQLTRDGKQYVSGDLTITTIAQPCSDGMSERRYAETVQVQTQGRNLHGCGGAVLPPETLADTHWRIVSIDGNALPANSERAPNMHFSGDRVSASVGCNTMMGSYAQMGARVTVSQLASTEMMCTADGMMQREARLAQILSGASALQFTAREELIMSGKHGGTIVLERIH